MSEFKDSPVGRIPVDWDCVPLHRITKRITTITESNPQNILTISSVHGWMDQREKWARNMAGQSLSKYTKLSRGEFAYNKGNSKTYPQGCIFRLDNYATAAIPNVYHSFSISSPNVDSDYLQQYFFSRAIDSQLRSVITSSVRNNGLLNITSETFFNTKVSTPPLPEQKKIASILTSVDDVIEKTQAQIAKLQDLKTGMMNELLTNGIGHTEFKDSKLGRIPKSWVWKNLVDMCQPKQWKTISGSELTATGYPVFGANGFIGFYPEYNHESETIVITCRGATCGTVSLVPPKTYITGNAMCLDNISKDLSQHYLLYATQYRTLSDVISGSAQPQITREGLRKVELPFPPLPEQKKIASILTSVDDNIEEKQRKLEHTQSLKKSLMQDLLTGKVRVQAA